MSLLQQEHEAQHGLSRRIDRALRDGARVDRVDELPRAGHQVRGGSAEEQGQGRGGEEREIERARELPAPAGTRGSQLR